MVRHRITSVRWQVPRPVAIRLTQSTNMNSLVNSSTWLNCSQGESGGRACRPAASFQPLCASAVDAGLPLDELDRQASARRARARGRAPGDKAGERPRRIVGLDPRRQGGRAAGWFDARPTRPAGAPARAGTGCSSGRGPAAGPSSRTAAGWSRRARRSRRCGRARRGSGGR